MKLIYAALALGVLSACAPSLQAQTSTQADAAAGLRLAQINCASCHAIGAEGESRHSMAPPFRTLSRNYPINALEEAFAEGVLVEHPDMPEFELTPTQIDDLLAYIESIQERRGG